MLDVSVATRKDAVAKLTASRQCIAELEALLKEAVPIMREGVYLVKTLTASQKKLRKWVRKVIANYCEPSCHYFPPGEDCEDCLHWQGEKLLEGASE